MTRPALQLDLFAGPAQHAPAPTFTQHETSILTTPTGPVVRVRLRLTGAYLDAPLAEGPLTFSECQAWGEPCALRSCRHRLDDDVELRTRRVREEEDIYGNPIEDLHGPRFPTGGFYRSSPLGHGDFCALMVAEEGEATLQRLGEMYGMTKEGASKQLVDPAIEAAAAADLDLNDAFEGLYGDAGKQHKFKFIPADDNLTSTEANRAVVPGEEPCMCDKCQCAVPSAAKGDPCPTCLRRVKHPGRMCPDCGRRVKRGRSAPTVRRMSRKDKWTGVTRVIPAEFADRVDVRLMNQLSPVQAVPAQFSDMSKMLAARAARKQ